MLRCRMRLMVDSVMVRSAVAHLGNWTLQPAAWYRRSSGDVRLNGFVSDVCEKCLEEARCCDVMVIANVIVHRNVNVSVSVSVNLNANVNVNVRFECHVQIDADKSDRTGSSWLRG